MIKQNFVLCSYLKITRFCLCSISAMLFTTNANIFLDITTPLWYMLYCKGVDYL